MEYILVIYETIKQYFHFILECHYQGWLFSRNQLFMKHSEFFRLLSSTLAYYFSRNLAKCFSFISLGNIGSKAINIITIDLFGRILLFFSQKNTIQLCESSFSVAVKEEKNIDFWVHNFKQNNFAVVTMLLFNGFITWF